MSDETPRRDPRRLQVYEADGITVTFDPARCFHSGNCIRSLPLVFDTSRRRWIRPECASVDEVATVVANCPSGALRFARADGVAESVPESLTMRPMRHGPLLVRGLVRLVRPDGSLILEDHRLALCRCGGTANPPFCDGTHVRQRFRDPVEPAPPAGDTVGGA